VNDESIGNKTIAMDNNKKRKKKKYCCAIWCSESDVTWYLTRVPIIPPALRKDASRRCQITRQIKLFTRREITDRLGCGRNDNTADLRYCLSHETETLPFTISCHIFENGIQQNITLPETLISLPKPNGAKSIQMPPILLSKGSAADRYAARILRNISCDAALLNQQSVVMNDVAMGRYALTDINPTVRKLAGLDVHVGCFHSQQQSKLSRKRIRTHCERIGLTAKKKINAYHLP